MDNSNDSETLIAMRNKVKSVVENEDFSKQANISFSFISEGTPQIRIGFDPNGGSWSFVGKENNSVEPGKPTMNLGWLSGDQITIDEQSVILHEFGHAIGLGHEHQSPFLGDKITLKEDGSCYTLSSLPQCLDFF